MATQLQIRRGTAAQVAAFTGAEGEIVYNSTNDSLHTNDGATAGGFELARADLNNVLDADLNAALTGNTLSALTITTLTAGAATFSDNVTLLKTTADANLQVQTTFAGADARLNLYGNSTGTSQIRFGDEASVNVGLLTYNHADDSLTARVGGSDALTIDSAGAATFSGDVGIGGGPSRPLHVYGPDGAGEGTPTFNANTVAVFQNNGTSADGTILNIVSGSASTGFIGFGTATDDIRQAIVANMSDDSLELRTGNNSTALTISASGNLGIGVNPSYQLDVYDTAAAFAAKIKNFNGSDAGGGLWIDTRWNTAGNRPLKITSNNEGTSIFEVTGNGNVGIGTSSPASGLELEGVGNATNITLDNITASTGRSYSIRSGNTGNLDFYDNDATSARMVIDASGNLGIGTATITNPYSQTNHTDVNINGVWGGVISFKLGGVTKGWVGQRSSGNEDMVIGATAGQELLFYENNVEAARISSGNLLVGTTDAIIYNNAANNATDNGMVYSATDSRLDVTRYTTNAAAAVASFNRTGNDGNILSFAKSGATVGSIEAVGGDLNIGTGNTALLFVDSIDAILPAKTTDPAAATRDNAIDLGRAATRFDDIYATNGTIQTSDRNEKQDIAELSDAEQRVAVAAKGLLRKFRWKDSVEEKGDDARIHFGIIAQDLQDAFTAEGLDAGRYAMFISSTWWETQTEVEAVEAVEFVQAVEAVYDEDGEIVSEAVEGVEAVDAKDAYIRTDTFATLEEAPEGATERTRLGVRYPELIAFIIAAI